MPPLSLLLDAPGTQTICLRCNGCTAALLARQQTLQTCMSNARREADRQCDRIGRLLPGEWCAANALCACSCSTPVSRWLIRSKVTVDRAYIYRRYMSTPQTKIILGAVKLASVDGVTVLELYSADIQGGVMKQGKMFLMRMRPEVRQLLDQAAAEQRRTRVSILEELILEAYGKRYQSTQDRLNKLLGGA